MKKSDEGAPVVVGKAYDFILWLLPKVENFPGAHRFTVGERLTTHGLDLLTSLVEAAYSRDKADCSIRPAGKSTPRGYCCVCQRT